jgi:uncharacterized protein
VTPARCIRLLAWFIACSLRGQGAAGQDVPPLTGRVVDRADVLSVQAERELTALLASHEEATGNQVAVLTIPSLQGAVLEDYALEVARRWALGEAGRDNGVLLLVAIEDRKLRIEVGYGLEGDLPDAVASRIIRREITPQFRAGDYEGGIRAGIMAILGTIEGTYTPPAAQEEAPPFWFGLLFMILPLFFALQALFSPGCIRWFLFVFLMPFFWVSGAALFGRMWGGWVVLGLYAAGFVVLSWHPKVRAVSNRLKEARRTGEKVRVGPFTIGPGSFGGSGGGGFSGGGGSFGGGGASGSW